MALVVANTSALVSLGTVVDHVHSPLAMLLEDHDVFIPEVVRSELEDTAAYDDPSGVAAAAVLDRLAAVTVRATTVEGRFPLDDGEHAVVTLANELDATQLLCDKFNRLALIHASLTATRLVTTPMLLIAFVRTGALSGGDAEDLLGRISEARSWEANTYVAQARETVRRL